MKAVVIRLKNKAEVHLNGQLAAVCHNYADAHDVLSAIVRATHQAAQHPESTAWLRDTTQACIYALYVAYKTARASLNGLCRLRARASGDAQEAPLSDVPIQTTASDDLLESAKRITGFLGEVGVEETELIWLVP